MEEYHFAVEISPCHNVYLREGNLAGQEGWTNAPSVYLEAREERERKEGKGER